MWGLVVRGAAVVVVVVVEVLWVGVQWVEGVVVEVGWVAQAVLQPPRVV